MPPRALRQSQAPGGAECSAKEANEVSRIQTRSEVPACAAPKPHSAPAAAAHEGSGSQPTRNERVEQKARFVTAMLRRLAPDDPAVRLLRMAVVRRDETLLDALIRQLQSRTPKGQ